MGFKGTLTDSKIYPPLPTIEELVAKEVAKVDEITSINILAGFDHTVDGKMYHFSYRLDDQSNFAQMNTAATLSLQLGTMTKAQLNAQYNGYLTPDGQTHPEVLPTALPENWQVAWQGHADGTSHTLMLTPQKYLELANAGGKHNQMALAAGWQIKTALRACKTEVELKEKVKELDLDIKLRDARDLKASKKL